MAVGAGKPAPQTLYVLDSSFNPPTKAHMRIASSALLHDNGPGPKRLLLLLAIQNADKAPKSASFEQRLAMMSTFATDLLMHLHFETDFPKGAEIPYVDIGVTKFPYFHDKATAISQSSTYAGNPVQVHLTGFDTLIRIFDAKYYPPEKTLAPLEPFLTQHRLRVTYRTDADWGDRKAQQEYLDKIRRGERDAEGAKQEWVKQIEMVEGAQPGEPIISSTKVREAAKSGDRRTLETMLTDGVTECVLGGKMYS